MNFYPLQFQETICTDYDFGIWIDEHNMVAGKGRNFTINSTFASETIDDPHEVEQNSLLMIVDVRTSIVVKPTSIGVLITVSQTVDGKAHQTVIAVFLAVARPSTSIDVTR